MSTVKNRTIRNFIGLVSDYSRCKCDRYDASIQRCLQVVCSMENLSVFDTQQSEIIEFFINITELLKICDARSNVGWKTVETVGHLAHNKEIRSFLQELELVPVLSAYFGGQTDPDRKMLILSVLETLTEGLTVHRSGLWLSRLLKNLTDSILEKPDAAILGSLLTVASNLSLENYVVINQLQRESRCDELLHYLMQLQIEEPLIQLHAAQVVFSLLAVGSINESMLTNYLASVLELVGTGVRINNGHIILRCSSILTWMSRDQLLIEMVHSAPLQELLQDCLDSLIPAVTHNSLRGATINSVLTFLMQLFRTNLLSGKKFSESLVPQMIPLLDNSEVCDNLLELLCDLLRSTPSLNLMDQPDFESTMQNLVQHVVQLVSADESPRRLLCAIQILQKLYKFSPLNARITSALQPETFVQVVASVVQLPEPSAAEEAKVPPQQTPALTKPESIRIVVEALTLLGQIACRGGDWLQNYSYLLGQSGVQRCLATAILHGDCHLKQSTLSLVGTLGFSTDSVAGLSDALNQLSPSGPTRAAAVSSGVADAAGSQQPPLSMALAPQQAHKIDKLMSKVQNAEGGRFWDNVRGVSDVVELMELRMERMNREEQRLRGELDQMQQQMSALQVSRVQMQSESGRLMTSLLNKDDQLRQVEAQQRALVRRLEHVQQQFGQAEASWLQERERLSEDRERLKQQQFDLATQQQSQLDALKKQNRQLGHRLDEVQQELQEALKTGENLRALARKRDKELENVQKELQETETTCQDLRHSLKKKDKECEERDKELEATRHSLRASEKLVKSLESQLLDAERQCKETRAELLKLEKIREFIHDISGGKKKLCEE